MATMFFAKVNVNSEVYEIYENPDLLDKILDKLLVNISQKKTIEIIEQKGKMGKKEDKFKVKFISLEKDVIKGYVAGRLIKIFKDDVEMYDSVKDDLSPLPTEDLARSCTFYFDLRKEYVAFTLGRYFKPTQFSRYFKELLNLYSKDVQFEVYLEKNADVLREKIYKMKKISKMEITLIPPNPNTEEFTRIFPQNTTELKDSRITKITQTYSASNKDKGINPKTSLIERSIDGVSKGYGEIRAWGKDSNEAPDYVTSEIDAPHKRPIHNNMKNSIPGVLEHGRAYITEILNKKRG